MSPTTYQGSRGAEVREGGRISWLTGLGIDERIRSQFHDGMPKFGRGLAALGRGFFSLHFLVGDLAGQGMGPQYLCVGGQVGMGLLLYI